jgi:dihydrofolate synthase/folylpolyglutamate synthase
MNYSEAINFLYNRLPVFHRIGAAAYKPGLDNTIKLMHSYDNPHQKFKSIHIAGTNGKGSVSHMLAAIFQKAGYKTGLYTSPHLVDFSERIRINGIPIDKNFVVDFVIHSKEICDEIRPSFFELTMAMAFCYFVEKQVDIAIIETGLGGRLDSTNIITPELSVITNIGFDHTEFLGNTLEAIAFEKAGIIKQKIPVVIGEYLEETRPVFVNKSTETDSPIIFASDEIDLNDIDQQEDGLKFSYQGDYFSSQLSGLYQFNNLKTVIQSIKTINHLSEFKIGNDAIREGLKESCSLTGIRGRWEKIKCKQNLYVDTAHNSHGIKELLKQIQNIQYKSLRIVFGMVKDKDIDSVLSLLPHNGIYYFANADSLRSLESDSLQNMASAYKLAGNAYLNVTDALKCALKDSDENDLVIVCGSNYVAGEALAYLDNHSI